MKYKDFFKHAMNAKALKFGTFTLKSGRKSPYYFNSGLFNSGLLINTLGLYYAEKIIESKIKFDILFGIAYKGIPLASITAHILYTKYNLNISIGYNRKEKKLHGEKGNIVGENLNNKKILIIDDIITSSLSITQEIENIINNKGKIVGACIALDRQEMAKNDNKSAVQYIESKYNFPIISITTFKELIKFAKINGQINNNIIKNINEYEKMYGI